MQYNHPPVDAAELIETRAFGADLLEVWNAPGGDEQLLADRISLFDVACRHRIFMTATGTSDDHTGVNWLWFRLNCLTSVWAASTDLPDLLSALASGQAWLHHLQHWRDGRINLTSDGVPVMGKVLTASEAEIVVTVDNVPSNATVTVIRGVSDGLGDAPSVDRVEHPASAFTGGPFPITMDRGVGAYLRVEVYAEDGMLIGMSNPCWLLPEGTEVPPARQSSTVAR
ncbi:hypothetical protein ACQBAU_12695 [Propionibacteriaceae bacterium Y2011]